MTFKGPFQPKPFYDSMTPFLAQHFTYPEHFHSIIEWFELEGTLQII